MVLDKFCTAAHLGILLRRLDKKLNRSHTIASVFGCTGASRREGEELRDIKRVAMNGGDFGDRSRRWLYCCTLLASAR